MDEGGRVDDGEIVEGVQTSTHYWKRVLRAHKPRFGQDFSQVAELLLTKINLKNKPTNTALYTTVRNMLLNIHSIRKACNYTFNPDKCSRLKLPTYAQLEALRIYGDNNSGFGTLPREIEDLLRATALGWIFRPRNPGPFPQFWVDFVRHDEQVFQNQKRQQEEQGGRALQKERRIDVETEELRAREPETGETGATVMPKQSAEVSSEIYESEAWKKAMTESIRAVDFKQIGGELLKEAFGTADFKEALGESLKEAFGSASFKRNLQEAWGSLMDSECFKQNLQGGWESFMGSERFKQNQQETLERVLDSERFMQKQQEALEMVLDSARFKKTQNEVESSKESEGPSASRAALGEVPKESPSKSTGSSDEGASSIGGAGSQKTPPSKDNYRKSRLIMEPDSDQEEN
ncbi:hypothetical protein Daesc_003673 [Daldinia eschscholtzii]|uniref:Uncharacterized protein n=1 Tax=Daldinia eschscholtzii TaxID=292717 RepID=A0AAX6MU25_9PEZI